MADEFFSRRADHQRRDRCEFAAARQKSDVVIEILREADAWIDEDLFDVRVFRFVDESAQLAIDVPHHVVVFRHRLHRARIAAHVHEDHRRIALRGQLAHPRIVSQRRARR